MKCPKARRFGTLIILMALFFSLLPLHLNAEGSPTPIPSIAPRPAPSVNIDALPQSDEKPLLLFLPDFIWADGQGGLELAAAVADALQVKERYQVVRLGDIPMVGSSTAQSLWDKCEDYLGCLTFLGDRAKADISIGTEVVEVEDGALRVHFRIYDLDWGAEVSGLDLTLPAPQEPDLDTPTPTSIAVAHEVGSASEMASPSPDTEGEFPEAIPESPSFNEETVLALVLALDARLIPIHLGKLEALRVAAQPWQEAPTPPPLQGGEAVNIEGGVGGLAESLASQDLKQRYSSAELRDAETEREILGLTPRQYGRYKRQHITESEWRRRLLGRTDQIALRLDLGVLGGAIAQQYDGIVLMGDVSTDIVEKYARLLPAAGKSTYGRLGLAYAVHPDAEAELRLGFGQSSAEVRTLQTFDTVYCTDASAEGCVSSIKTENVPTRLFTMEWVARYYFRRPWDLKPYLSLGFEMLRLQDIASAYELNSTFDFPLIYDPFPAMWSVGLSGALGVAWQVLPNIALTAELPAYRRLLLGVSDPLHFYASEPQVEEPAASSEPPIAAGISFGLSMRLR